MNRPISPSSILYPPQEDIDDIGEIPIADWVSSAGIALEYLKQKLNKTSISPGDGLLELFNFDVHDESTDNELLVPLFCLVICLLRRSRDTLNTIDPNTYDSLFNYTIDIFNTKSNEMS